MSRFGHFPYARLLAAALPIAWSLAGHAALASDPLPGDLEAPPVNINIGMFYTQFSDAGAIGAVHGSTDHDNTHISIEATTLRYIRIFDVDGFTSGFQIFETYVGFLGAQEAGVGNIAGPDVPALGGQLPSYGAGRANLTHTSGFAEPNLSVFFYPLNNPTTGTYAVISPWLEPPVSSFNKDSALNPSQNVWVYELELGFRHQLIGTPTEPNLAIELWSSSYGYGSNNNSAYDMPEVSANNIPAAYAEYHLLSGGQIPDSNPLQAYSSTPASFHEHPTEEFRVYLPYEFAPSMDAFIAPGFYQSFGGKQTYTLRNGTKVDSGNRTEESQLRLIAETFVSPSLQIMLIGDYDIAAHGAALNRTLDLRIAKFF